MITVFSKVLVFINKANKLGGHSLRISPLYQYQNANIDTLRNPQFNFRFELIIQNNNYLNTLPQSTQELLKLQAQDIAREYFFNKVAHRIQPVFN